MEKRVRESAAELAAVREQVRQQEQRWQAVTRIEPPEPAHIAAPEIDDELIGTGLVDTDQAALRTQFLALLIEHFDTEELMMLCFHIGVRWESLKGETADGKARELVLKLDREGKLYKLVAEGQRQRPGVLWPTP